MPFVLPTPSLQHVAQVKIVAALWHHPGILTQIAQKFNGVTFYETLEDLMQWKEIKEKVESNVKALLIPETWKKELLEIVRPLGIEAVICICHYAYLDNFSRKYLDILIRQQLCWTMHGTVDYPKTAESMVKDLALSVVKRYELACLNCLEDEARQLFPLVPDERRRMFMNEEVQQYCRQYRLLILYFTCTLSDNLEPLNRRFESRPDLGDGSIHKRLFAAVFSEGTRATCEYLFNKLSPQEKYEVLRERQVQIMSGRPTRSPSCDLMHFLSLLNEEQRRQMFTMHTKDVLMCLLRWPMQSLFMEAAEGELRFLSKDGYNSVVDAIITKIRCASRDYDSWYSQLFWKVWRLSPADYRQDFLSFSFFLEKLFDTKEEEIIKLILNDTPWYSLKELVENRYDRIRRVLLDESAISDAALEECKQTAALISSNEPRDDVKRLRSIHLSRLIDIAMDGRIKSRRRLIEPDLD